MSVAHSRLGCSTEAQGDRDTERAAERQPEGVPFGPCSGRDSPVAEVVERRRYCSRERKRTQTETETETETEERYAQRIQHAERHCSVFLVR